MLEDQYGIGDAIVTPVVAGTVEAVGLRITKLRTDDGTIWYLRNGEILSVGNRSQGDLDVQNENTSSERAELERNDTRR